MKKIFSLALIMVLALGVLAGCNGETKDPVNGGEEITYTYNNGIFTAFSDEGRGWMKVQITITNDKIRNMKIWEFSNMGVPKDYETYGTPEDGRYPVGKLKATHDALIKAVIAADSANIDVVTGSTSSSNKAIKAVERAMELALVTPASTNTYFNGKFAAAYRGERGAVIAHVTIENDKITEVFITETSIREGVESFKDYETYGNDTFTGEFLKETHETLVAAFVAANSADIDIVTGATGTSTGAIEAVKAALENAKR